MRGAGRERFQIISRSSVGRFGNSSKLSRGLGFRITGTTARSLEAESEWQEADAPLACGRDRFLSSIVIAAKSVTRMEMIGSSCSWFIDKGIGWFLVVYEAAG